MINSDASGDVVARTVVRQKRRLATTLAPLSSVCPLLRLSSRNASAGVARASGPVLVASALGPSLGSTHAVLPRKVRRRMPRCLSGVSGASDTDHWVTRLAGCSCRASRGRIA